MLTHMAQELSSFFISKAIIKEEEREVYDYCFEIFLATIINFFSIITLAFISKTVLPTICFIAGFILSFIAIILVFALESEKCGFSIAAGMCVVSLSLIAGSIKNRLKKKTDGKECNQ